MGEILTLQQDMILKKAAKLVKAGTPEQKKKAAMATKLIVTSRDVESIKADRKVLQPAEYTVRAEAMIAARRLVGGVEIEVVQDMKAGKKK